MLYKLTLLIVFSLGLSGLSAQKSYPLFTGCIDYYKTDTAMQEQCSQEAFELLLNTAKGNVYKEVGCFFTDEASFKLSFSSSGSVKIKSLKTQNLKFIEDILKDELENLLKDKLTPRLKKEKILINTSFDLPEMEALNVNECEQIPTLPNCAEFNTAGQFSCFFSIIDDLIKTLPLRKYDGFTSMDLVFNEAGRFLGIKFKLPVEPYRRYINDSIITRFTKLNRYRDLKLYGPQKEHGYYLTYTYNNFESEVNRRRQFESMTPTYLAEIDTSLYLSHLVSVASTFSRYDNYIDYVEEIALKYKLDQEKNFGYFGRQQASLDSVLSVQYFFSTSTNDLLAKPSQWPRPRGCPEYNQTDSSFNCMKDYIIERFEKNMKALYDINVHDTIYGSYSNYDGPDIKNFRAASNIYPGEIGVKISINDNGEVSYVKIVAYHENLTAWRYTKAMQAGAGQAELKRILAEDINYKYINALTQLSTMKPAKHNARNTWCSFLLWINTGPKS
jgi:hypothetical protein